MIEYQWSVIDRCEQPVVVVLAHTTEGGHLVDAHFLQLRLTPGGFQRGEIGGQLVDMSLLYDQVELATFLDGVRGDDGVATGPFVVMKASPPVALLRH